MLSKLKSFNVSRDPGDGWRRSDSGETRAGTKASKTILVKDALFPYQKVKSFKIVEMLFIYFILYWLLLVKETNYN